MNKIIWRVFGLYGYYYAERIVDGRATDYRDISAHCLACAKSELMAETGELVDIRGWQKQGLCGDFLKAMHMTIKEEIDGES